LPIATARSGEDVTLTQLNRTVTEQHRDRTAGTENVWVDVRKIDSELPEMMSSFVRQAAPELGNGDQKDSTADSRQFD